MQWKSSSSTSYTPPASSPASKPYLEYAASRHNLVEQLVDRIHSHFSAANLAILLQIPKRETVPAFNHPQLIASRLWAYISHDDWRRRLGQAKELGECPGRTKPLGRSRRGDLRQQPGYWQETSALTPFLKSSVNFATSTPQSTPILSISSIPPIARQFQLWFRTYSRK